MDQASHTIKSLISRVLFFHTPHTTCMAIQYKLCLITCDFAVCTCMLKMGGSRLLEAELLEAEPGNWGDNWTDTCTLLPSRVYIWLYTHAHTAKKIFITWVVRLCNLYSHILHFGLCGGEHDKVFFKNNSTFAVMYVLLKTFYGISFRFSYFVTVVLVL